MSGLFLLHVTLLITCKVCQRSCAIWRGSAGRIAASVILEFKFSGRTNQVRLTIIISELNIIAP